MSDRKLRQEFDALRESDRETSPEFGTIWSRAKSVAVISGSDTGPAIRWVPLAASVVIGALLWFGALRQKVASPKEPAVMSTITTWQSPTSALLRSSGQTLLAPTSIFSSVLDGVASVSVSRDIE